MVIMWHTCECHIIIATVIFACRAILVIAIYADIYKLNIYIFVTNTRMQLFSKVTFEILHKNMYKNAKILMYKF